MDSYTEIKSISPDRRRPGDRRSDPEDPLVAGARMLFPAIIGAVLSVFWFAVGYWCGS